MRFFTWLSGFVEEGTAQSSTRVGMYALLTATITYAFGKSPEPEILLILMGGAAAFGGIKLWKDIRAPKTGGDTPPPVAP